MNYNEYSHQLLARLPELEWRLSKLNKAVTLKVAGNIFRNKNNLSNETCIDEIRYDLKRLEMPNNTISAEYLAKSVLDKINFLVRFCKINETDLSKKADREFGIKSISTRQQWLSALEEDIVKLEQQQFSINTRMSQVNKDEVDTLLGLQAALGEVSQKLTLLQEKYEQAIR